MGGLKTILHKQVVAKADLGENYGNTITVGNIL